MTTYRDRHKAGLYDPTKIAKQQEKDEAKKVQASTKAATKS